MADTPEVFGSSWHGKHSLKSEFRIQLFHPFQRHYSMTPHLIQCTPHSTLPHLCLGLKSSPLLELRRRKINALQLLSNRAMRFSSIELLHTLSSKCVICGYTSKYVKYERQLGVPGHAVGTCQGASANQDIPACIHGRVKNMSLPFEALHGNTSIS